ncbi:MAG TPA: DUF4349 domain-containing protein [Nevskiaceae bacterium]|nr:DUF4349 domain-containing protein [Nevskiaceae bacterium]
MQKIIGWIKQNKLAAFLLALVIGYLLFKNFLPSVYQFRQTLSGQGLVGEKTELGMAPRGIISPPQTGYAPAPEVEDRLVIQESTLSLLVKKVTETQKAINEKIKQLGGYMVNSSVTHPEETETATGSITVRVSQERLDEALDYFRNVAVKVVSENLVGRDVTDEYVDIEARLATLLKTKVKFEEILEKAEKVDDILRVQRELVSLQTQIDNLKGRQNYLEKSAQMSKVTVYLATDELSLPYAPSLAWRPQVVFKRAVRSLVSTARKLGTTLIWLGVYAVIWVPISVVWLVLRRRKKKLAS